MICALKLINYSFLFILVKKLGHFNNGTLKICSRNRGPFSEKKGKLKTLTYSEQKGNVPILS